MAITDAKVDDERGKRVVVDRDLASPPSFKNRKYPPGSFSTATLRWRAAERWTVGSSLALFCTMLPLGFLGLRFLSSTVFDFIGNTIVLLWFVSVPVAYVVHLVSRWHWSGPGRRYAARALAARGTCPRCGYGITGVPSDADGLTTCPECASAWRVGAIASCERCEYSLMGVEPDAEGSMRCPDCGWQWKRAADA